MSQEPQYGTPNQRGVEHNYKAFLKQLHQEGHEAVVCRPLSRFTMLMHTRTLSPEEEREFIEWAEQKDSVTEIEGDPDGRIFRVKI